MGELQRLQRWLKVRANRPLKDSDIRAMRRWNERCLELEETYDAHTGHPIGGMAHRLGSELSWHIDEYERRLKAADDEFEACRAQMIRELEGV